MKPGQDPVKTSNGHFSPPRRNSLRLGRCAWFLNQKCAQAQDVSSVKMLLDVGRGSPCLPLFRYFPPLFFFSPLLWLSRFWNPLNLPYIRKIIFFIALLVGGLSSYCLVLFPRNQHDCVSLLPPCLPNCRL